MTLRSCFIHGQIPDGFLGKPSCCSHPASLSMIEEAGNNSLHIWSYSILELWLPHCLHQTSQFMRGFSLKSGTNRQGRSFPQYMSIEVSFYRKKYGIMIIHMMGGISVKGTYENGDYFKSVLVLHMVT